MHRRQLVDGRHVAGVWTANHRSPDFQRNAAEGRGNTLNGRTMHTIDTDYARL